jgi:hypothetical protein
MAKYKVLVIALSVKNNKIAKSGDIVDDSMLNTPAHVLVQNGFLKEIEEDAKEEVEAEVVEVKPTPAKATKPKANK